MSTERHHTWGGTVSLDPPTAPLPAVFADGPVRFADRHYFNLQPGADLDTVVASWDAPLSVILPVTRRCTFDCLSCAHVVTPPDPTFEQLARIRANLTGVQRVVLTGGEPFLRRDLGEVIDLFTDNEQAPAAMTCPTAPPRSAWPPPGATAPTAGTTTHHCTSNTPSPTPSGTSCHPTRSPP